MIDFESYVADMSARSPSRDATARAESEAAEARRLRAWRSSYDASVPVRAAACGWEPDDTLAVRAVRTWLADGCQAHLVLRGGVGVGKTTAACVAAKAWLEPGSLPSFFEQPRISWLRPDQLVSAVLHSYDERSPKLRERVIVEDWGRHERNRDDATEAMCALLDMANVTVLLTTNLTRQQIRERYDGRLLDRLRDTCVAVDIAGESLRKRNTDF